MKAIERFEGTDGRRRLVDALCEQKLVSGDRDLADLLATQIELLQFDPGDTLMTQGVFDNDLYFLVLGRTETLVNGRQVAVREAGVHLGEMAMIDPASPRTATVNALTYIVVARLTEPQFTAIANNYPRLWRGLAIDLCPGRSLFLNSRWSALRWQHVHDYCRGALAVSAAPCQGAGLILLPSLSTPEQRV